MPDNPHTGRPDQSPPDDSAAIDIEQIARLTRLHLSDAEMAQMEQDMRQIVGFAGALSAVDTGGDTPAAPAPRHNVLREDTIVPPMASSWLTDGAPAALDGYILVPRVVE